MSIMMGPAVRFAQTFGMRSRFEGAATKGPDSFPESPALRAIKDALYAHHSDYAFRTNLPVAIEDNHLDEAEGLKIAKQLCQMGSELEGIFISKLADIILELQDYGRDKEKIQCLARKYWAPRTLH